MATTKASRKAKRESYGRGNDSDNGSKIIKTRKAHDSKEAITKGAVKKSDATARQTREYVMKKDKPMRQNGRQPGRQLIRWNGKPNSFCIIFRVLIRFYSFMLLSNPKNSVLEDKIVGGRKVPHETYLSVRLVLIVGFLKVQIRHLYPIL